MNDKTREQIEAMKNQTIGVEIEMNNITREKLRQNPEFILRVIFCVIFSISSSSIFSIFSNLMTPYTSYT